MLKDEDCIKWAERLDKSEEGIPFLEDVEFDEVLSLLPGVGGWKGIVTRLKDKGYSEFKIGFTIGELRQKILKSDSDIIEIEDIL